MSRYPQLQEEKENDKVYDMIWWAVWRCIIMLLLKEVLGSSFRSMRLATVLSHVFWVVCDRFRSIAQATV